MPDPTNPTPTPAQQMDQAHTAAVSALDAALEDKPLPEPAAAEPAKADKPAKTEAKADPPADEKPDPMAEAADPAKPAEAAKPEDKAADPAKPKADAEKPKDEEAGKEADALGLKEKARERFVELTSQVKEAAPFREAATKAGITDPAQIPALAQRAKVGEDMVQMVQETGADAQQYGKALDYLAAANAASKGDLKAAEACFNWMLDELKVWAPLLGKEVPGLVDPLAAHPDLLRDIEDERISRDRALEIARSRTTQAVRTNVEQTERQRQQQEAHQQQAQAQAVEEAKADLTALGKDLQAADPQGYAAKFPQLAAIIQSEIVAKFPPHKWATEAAKAYARIKIVAPAAAPAQAATGTPVRSAGPRPAVAPEFTDPMKALEAGIDLGS